MLPELPFPVGGLVMSFVPPPERAPVRRACRTTAAWRADAVAVLLLDPGEADRLRHPRRGPCAVAAMPVDGWWRERALVVRVLGVCDEERKRTRGGEPVPLDAQALLRARRPGTVLPEAGWAGVLALFPAARAVELPELLAPPGGGLELPPPGVALVVPSNGLWARLPGVRHHRVCACGCAFLRGAPLAHDELQGALRGLCRGVYPPGGLQLCAACTAPPMPFAQACAEAAAAGFAPLGLGPPPAADAETILLVVGSLSDARATHVNLNRHRHGEAAEVADGTEMAAIQLSATDATPKLLAKVCRLAWPRLRDLTLCPSGDNGAEWLRALRWAACLPRLHTLSLGDGVPVNAAAVGALCSGLDRRARGGGPPLRLALKCRSVAAVVRLAEHPGAALVHVRLSYFGDYGPDRRAAMARVCAALAAPAGPAVLEALQLIVLPPVAVRRTLARAQPFLRRIS